MSLALVRGLVWSLVLCFNTFTWVKSLSSLLSNEFLLLVFVGSGGAVGSKLRYSFSSFQVTFLVGKVYVTLVGKSEGLLSMWHLCHRKLVYSRFRCSRIFPGLVRSISRANSIPFARKEVLAVAEKSSTPKRFHNTLFASRQTRGRSESTDTSDLLVVVILKL